jgi:glycosidase
LHNGHFDYLYDKVGLYDTLRSVVCGHAGVTAITETWRGVQDIRHRMLNFLENHDEQRIASSFFAGDPEKAKPALVVSACMTDNPFMLYFGQELGERGMDVEGFSGMDGRTTIFDYWSVDTVRRWVHKGKFSVSKLTKKEKELRDYYKTILQLNQREGILQGEGFFDLMYVNPYSEYFDNNKEYAFLRYAGKHVVLVVANFSDGMLHTKVNIPAHAFECMKISPAQGQVKAKELISGEQLMVTFSPNAPLDILVPAYGAVMVKI